jgi:SAM-dependent methyltransferase
VSASPEFLARVERHWTPEREAKVTGGKDWPLKPRAAASLLRVIGLMSGDASIPADAVRKVSQINHMVTLLLPQLEELAQRHPAVRIVDACCGTSYLALMLAWLGQERFGGKLEVVGVDRNEKLIETSRKRASDLGLERIAFQTASIGAGIEGRVHLLAALHACDTATDHAVAAGIEAKADVIAVAPCCHAELASKWKEHQGRDAEAFAPIFRSPNLRRETAAQITDAMRMLLIRSKGYEVTATEFVPSEHTPKNRLLVCIRRGNYLKEAGDQYERLKAAVGGEGILLETLLSS